MVPRTPLSAVYVST
uniref:Uncharacterized protein n=1 Tax=Arundo donax TaxID=35708 RepID=A0A0A9C3P3_ARUDO